MTPLIAHGSFSVIQSVFETAKPATFPMQIMGMKRIGDYCDITLKMADFVAVLEEFTRSERFSAKQKLGATYSSLWLKVPQVK